LSICGSEACLEAFLQECIRLDDNDSIETSFLLFPNAMADFNDYLELAELAEALLDKHGYEGVYQVASFHPDYCFAGESADDAANYTNRSIYPMLHLLREETMEQAIARYPNPESIPDKNIDFARKKGLAYMQLLRDKCF
jgi:uncharacterized protein